jgi:SNF2 family DNA or RNA helicase
MLVVPKHKTLLLRTRNPAKIHAICSRAHDVQYKGKAFVAVPHVLSTTKRLNGIGIRAPSPILHYYTWPRSLGIAAPFVAQAQTAAFLTFHDRAYCLNGLGSGKTLAALWAYDYLRSKGKANKLLVVSPLSTVDLTWGDAIFEHFPHLNYVVLHHATRDKRIKLLDIDTDIYITNHDGAEILEPYLNKRPDIDIVIVDELAQCARNAQTKMWKSLNKIVNARHHKDDPQPYRKCWGLTATPMPNKPTDAWAQARLITPHTVPKYFTAFRERVMRQQGPYLWLPRDNALDVVHQSLQPAIRYSREECVDLPPTTYTDRHVELTAEQKKAYHEMQRRLQAELAEGKITAANEAVKAGKLVQIACGVVYDQDKNEVAIPCKPRLEEVKELVSESQTKTIVFAPFVSVVHLITNYLRKAGFSVEMIYGDVSKSKRLEIFHAFQRTALPQVIVAQPSAMSHGLTLTASSTIIWYAPIVSADTYGQANGRITRPGQTVNTLIVHISGTAEERKMYARLKNKERMQGILLDMVVESRDA